MTDQEFCTVMSLSEKARTAVEAIAACKDRSSDEYRELDAEAIRRLQEFIRFGESIMPKS